MATFLSGIAKALFKAAFVMFFWDNSARVSLVLNAAFLVSCENDWITIRRFVNRYTLTCWSSFDSGQTKVASGCSGTSLEGHFHHCGGVPRIILFLQRKGEFHMIATSIIDETRNPGSRSLD